MHDQINVHWNNSLILITLLHAILIPPTPVHLSHHHHSHRRHRPLFLFFFTLDSNLPFHKILLTSDCPRADSEFVVFETFLIFLHANRFIFVFIFDLREFSFVLSVRHICYSFVMPKQRIKHIKCYVSYSQFLLFWFLVQLCSLAYLVS